MKTKLKTFIVQCKVERRLQFLIEGKNAAAVAKRLQEKSHPEWDAIRRQYSDAEIVNIMEGK